MSNIKAGLIGGFAGTVALSALMILKGVMGVMPDLDVIHMLATMMGASVLIGWVAHFIIGTVAWGGGFAVFYDKVPGSSSIAKGIVFGLAAWLIMMIAVMPMAGAGFFGMNFGPMAAVMTMMLHVVFGAVMGAVYKSQANGAVA